MSSTTESGYAMLVAKFEELVNFVIGYGNTLYNPGKNGIKLNALTVQLVAAQTALFNVKEAKIYFDNNSNLREIAFSSLRKFCTRLFNILAATDASQQTLDDARSIINKINGRRAGKKATAVEGEEAPATNSVSQQSFDRLVDNFELLIMIVSAEPTYTPNEQEFTPTGLQATLQDLRMKNTSVISSAVALRNARDERDVILYGPITGVSDTAKAVKAYVKGLCGSDSTQYKNLSAIKF